MNVLFICSRNKLRSPTAAQVFDGRAGIATDSAGLAPDAECQLELDQLAWADIVFVMEKSHRTKLTRLYSAYLRSKKLICLDIPDNYTFMQPELIELFERKVPRHLGLGI